MRDEKTWNSNFKSVVIRNNFSPRIALDLAKFPDFPKVELGSYFIYGDICTGKTIVAAKLMLMELRKAYLENRDVSALFVSFPDLLMSLRNSFSGRNNALSESEVMNRFLNCDILVLDDFMTTKPSDWVVDVIYHLINHRYEYLLTTIITSNKDLDELEVLLGDQRITSRINRMCGIIEKQPFSE
jgi:DNA replication protein DnaC